METVLITDGEQRSALAVARSLGRAGYRILVASAHSLPIAGGSRFCQRTIRVPDPTDNPGAFADAIATISEQERADWVLPITESALKSLLPARQRLCGRLPFPTAEAFEAISDKARVLDAARAVGIDTPYQIVVRSAEEAPATWDGSWPLVVKPSRSVNSGHRFSVAYASSAGEMRACIRAMPASAFPLLLQERIIGPGTGIFLLIWDGIVRAGFAHRRIREKPPSGGVSVVAESIEADPGFVALSAKLLHEFGWLGVAMVEFKHDTRSGRTVLMEVNGRFWGSLQLAVDSGVDFPRLLIDCASGDPPGALPTFRVGHRGRWWWGDVDQVIMRLRHSARELSLVEATPGRGRAIREFLAERASNEILRRDDPWPAVRETINWVLRR